MKKRILALLCIFSLLCGCAKVSLSEKDTIADETTKKEEASTTLAVEEVTTKGFVPTEINVVAVGDILLHENVSDSGKRDDGTYNYDHLFKYVKDDVLKADVSIVNQEVILGGTQLGLSGYPCFNGAYEVGDALAAAGFNVILHATNHTLDRGKTAILNCMNFWDTKHPEVAYIGINKNQEEQDEKIYVYEKEGIKIAVLNYTYGTNGIPLPSDMPYVVNLIDKTKMAADIKKAKEKADIVIVCPHWGIEYTHVPSAAQKDLAQFMLEEGVDIVIGTHPHVIQPVEVLERADGHKMVCYYSLGNYINSTAESGRGTADRMIGAMANITITNDEMGNVFIKEYGIIPLVTQMLFGKAEITTYKFADYTEKLAAENGIKQRDPVFSYTYVKSVFDDVFGDLMTSNKKIGPTRAE